MLLKIENIVAKIGLEMPFYTTFDLIKKEKYTYLI